MRNGVGEFHFTDGSKRECNFVNDLEEGLSIHHYADGTIEIQIFINGIK